MKESIFRRASKIAALALLAVGAATLAACGSPAEGESTASTESAMKCSFGSECGAPAPGCDPGTQCCYAGGQALTASACGAALYHAGCRSTSGGGKAWAIQTDGPGHWWFEAYCPESARDAATAACSNVGISFNTTGNMCAQGNPGVGQVDVMYDPDCPSGCMVEIN